MRSSARVGMTALAVMLALAFVPLAMGGEIAFSHPRMNDLRMELGETRTYEVSVYNYGSEQVAIKMSAENLQQVATLDPQEFILSPGAKDIPTIKSVRCIFTPTSSGVFEGEILASPIEPGTGISIGNVMGCKVKITVTDGVGENNGPNEPTGDKKGGIPTVPIVAVGIIGIVAVGAAFRLRKRGQKTAYWLEGQKLALLLASLLILIAPIASAGEDNIQGSAAVTAPTPYAVNISISPSSRSAASGNVTYTVTVTNDGDNTDNYDLTVEDTLGWTVSLSDNLLENIAPSGSSAATLTVTLGVSGTDTITVTATSQGDNTVSDNANCTATVEEVGGGVPTQPTVPEKPEIPYQNWFWLAFGSYISLVGLGGRAAAIRRWRMKDFYLVAVIGLVLMIWGMHILGTPSGYFFPLAFGGWLTLVVVGGYATEKRRWRMGDFYLVALVSLILLIAALARIGVLETLV